MTSPAQREQGRTHFCFAAASGKRQSAGMRETGLMRRMLPHECFQLLDRHRTGKQVTLVGSASMAGEENTLLFIFDSLGNHRQAEAFSQSEEEKNKRRNEQNEQHNAHKRQNDFEQI